MKPVIGLSHTHPRYGECTNACFSYNTQKNPTMRTQNYLFIHTHYKYNEFQRVVEHAERGTGMIEINLILQGANQTSTKIIWG